MSGPVTDLASPEEARSVLASLTLDSGREQVPLSAARGRVLAERIDAGIDVPGFDRASMDGYAVRAGDTAGAGSDDPVVLSLAGVVRAGEPPDVDVEAGDAVEISTGAVMPEDADAVVIVERTTERDGRVEVRSAVSPGDNVMPAGADVAAGSRALGPGTILTPREVGLLAALGVDRVPVVARPRVGIVPTGGELVEPGEPLDAASGEIYDANSSSIAAGIEEAGGEAVQYPRVGDDVAEMEELLGRAASECDLVLSSGSTSASETDVIHRVIEERGTMHIHGIAIKPGKPTIVGELEGAVYVGLPGYPVSALTIFRELVAPLVREAAGLPEPATATVSGAMAVEERFAEARHRFVPVGLVEDGDGNVLVYPVDKGSGATTSLANGDGVVEMPADVSHIARGREVDVSLFSPDVRPPGLLCVGEDDPLLSRLLDELENPRFLPSGTVEGRRQLADGLPDVAVAAGPTEGDDDVVDLGGWRREWGLVVARGNPADVEGVADLVDRDLSVVNREPSSGLRGELDEAVASLARERGVEPRDLEAAIAGYDRTRKAFESPARVVAAGRADAGLGLRATAEALDLGFVPLGRQDVRVLANQSRTGKEGVRALADVLDGLSPDEYGVAGYERPGSE